MTTKKSQYCDVDGVGLDEDGICARCEASSAAEQAEDGAEDMEYEL